jgi:two-component system sensor histidine kinase KdpD
MPDPRNLSLVFFGAVLLVGFLAGLRPALLAALLAFFTYNFFLIEPRFTLHFSPADMLALASFLIGALLVGGLSGRLSDRALDATERLRDLTSLFQASRDLSSAVRPHDAATCTVYHLERGGCRAALWLHHKSAGLEASSPDTASLTEQAKANIDALLKSKMADDLREDRWLLRLETAERSVGAVAVWPSLGDAKVRLDRRWLDAMLELGAIAIDRARLISEVAEATIVAEKEGLRTALLSSLSHDLRTPLSSILASATALQEHGELFDVQTRSEMLETIQDESEKLNRYVGNLLEMTRLESGALQLKSVLIDPGEALASAIEHVSQRLKERRVLRAFNVDGWRILVDPVLLEQALVNIVENAIAYSPPASTILIATERDGDRILLSVEDEGPGIPKVDLDRVFDKFFRGNSDRRSGSGVGLGLSVARGLIESFGGGISAMNGMCNGKGARIEIRLPAYPALEAVE